jgi:hypothetical protein
MIDPTQLINTTSKNAGETRTIIVSFSDELCTGEVLDGDPTVTEYGTSALTITDAAKTSKDWIIRGQTIPASEAVEFSVSGGTARNDYTIRITVATTASPIQTLVKEMRLHVI